MTTGDHGMAKLLAEIEALAKMRYPARVVAAAAPGRCARDTCRRRKTADTMRWRVFLMRV